MAINPNPSLANRNTLYFGRSGAGKSQALKQNTEIPNRGARVVLYDPNEDHKAHRYRTKASFGKAVLRSIKSGQGFRIAYTGGFNEADHEWFCAFVWSVLDGNKITYMVDEELGSAGQRTGAAAPDHARIMNQGRKYGLRYHGVVQFPTELPKTVYRNCEVKICGVLDYDAAKAVSREMGAPIESITQQKNLSFLVKDAAANEPLYELHLKYRANI